MGSYKLLTINEKSSIMKLKVVELLKRECKPLNYDFLSFKFFDKIKNTSQEKVLLLLEKLLLRSLLFSRIYEQPVSLEKVRIFVGKDTKREIRIWVSQFERKTPLSHKFIKYFRIRFN